MTSNTSARARGQSMPRRGDLVDAGFLVVLSAIALSGFATTYSGWSYLVVGLSGVVLGVLVGHLANMLNQPVITLAALTVATFFLAGGAVVLRAQAIGGVLPSAATMRGLADGSVNGWKQLLTTLPPVDGRGPLLVLPYLLGLLVGAAGFAVASRMRPAVAPVGAPLLLLVATILLGTTEQPAPVLRGGVFAALALAWSAVRARRLRPQARDGSRHLVRLGVAAAILGVATGIATLVGPVLPGTGGDRVVLRDLVTPPFEIGAYPSPLVGFRKYTKDARQLWDQTLFTVSGLPSGATVRIATLDDYNGSVWGAADQPATAGPRNSFQRVGDRIPTAATGRAATLTFTVSPAYATATDVSAWLPTAGVATSVAFTGPASAGHTENLRYNLATSSGIVADRLRAGDTYTVDTILEPVGIPDDAQPFGPSTADPAARALVSSKAQKWAGDATSVAGRLRAAAAYLREHGAYSDGGPGESEYLPGHSLGRLTTFFNAPRPVGDDEQYAAAFALVANELGMPARVVLGATPKNDGAVRGKDVHAWVELHLADGRWVPVPHTEFMPDTSKKPDKQPPQEFENTDASIVPPPNTSHPPSTLDDLAQTDPSTNRAATSPEPGTGGLPAIIGVLLRWVGLPLLVLGTLCGAIIGAKTVRRNRRRTRGHPAARVAAGWREVLDHVRDLGMPAPRGGTRWEQARSVADQRVTGLASHADTVVFGAAEPGGVAADEFWTAVATLRAQLGREAGRWRRFRAAISLRSIRPGTT
ncbi:transglutaminaseTgpA domain-containing protein [Actinophytocola sp.]|uniref:transglutaminase family protein n=1 Tax=Actinophytocola sp. TaxID=1872138 RepID=UPI002ED069C7